MLFKAPDLTWLGQDVSEWLAQRPGYETLSFSHAVEMSWQRHSAFANAQPVPTYTGVLLVRHQ